MSGIKYQLQRGDTIIEVLFAVTVFALVAVGSLSIMNQGTGTAQRSLEITQVRSQIDAQAEAIRFIHQSYIAQYQQGGVALTGKAALWPQITTSSDQPASEFGVNGGNCPDVPGRAFALNARTVEMAGVQPGYDTPNGVSFPPYSQVAYGNESNVVAVYGLWVEAVKGDSDKGPGYYDFHIRVCWDSPGSDVPVTLGTIVRLYEPER